MVRDKPTLSVLALAKRRGILTASEVDSEGIHRQALTRLVREGKLERVARGRYRVPKGPVTANRSLAEISASAPRGVICLLSALSFHDLTTQLPADIWIAVERRARKPVLKNSPVRVVRFGGEAYTEGIEAHKIEGQTVRIYNVSKIGLDVALEALRDGWRGRRYTMDELNRYARVCRVERVMKPYLESLVA
jgi:predicted transcriptional regulator of viral defense system